MTSKVHARWRRVALLGALLCLAVTAQAQSPSTGAISGTVVDPQGAFIPGALLTIVNTGTGLSRSTTTSADGRFGATLLVPGTYSVAVEASGFARKVLRSVNVEVTETAVVQVRVEIGTSSTEIKVDATPELAQTETSALGRVTDARTIVALPLANRNFSQILALSPGVVVEIPNAGNLGRNTQNVSVNGAKTTSNNFQFDGVDANNISQNSASGFDPEVGIAVPAPDTIAEFKVQTGMYDAQYGRGAGGNVNIISKSGSNRFHGTLWEFFRNDALNANDFFVKQQGQPRPVLKQNQFGGAIGGPIRKDKTFFYGSYQASIQRNGFAPNVSLQTASLPLLVNDRSASTLGAAFCPENHSPGDPFFQTAGGGKQVACDGSNINPAALAILNFKFPNGQFAIPSPQTTSSGSDFGESTFSSPAHYREDQFSTNLDHYISGNNQLSGRFFYSRATTKEPFTPFGANLPGWGTDESQRNDMLVLSDTQVFRPTLVNVARFGFMRFNGFLSGEEPISAADVGMATPSGLPEIPGIAINGLFTIGPAGQPFYFQNTNTFVWQDTVSWVHGRHNLRTGAEVKRHQVAVNVPFVTDGFLFFLTFPDFLLGMSAAENGSAVSNVSSSVGASGNFRKDQRYTDLSGFLQDDIKVSRRLTVNAGLRYEYFGPPNEIHGHLSNFDPAHAALQAPPEGTFSGFVLPANYHGPLPGGVEQSRNSGMWNSDYKDFAPRLGFALQLLDRPTVVLRGGYGVYYGRLSGQLVEQNLGQQPFSLTQRLAGAANAAATLQQPYNPLLPPNSAYPIFIPRTPDSGLFLAAIAQSMPTPYIQQYDLNIQDELFRDLLLQVGYVGSKTTHETGCVEFNQALIASPAHPVNGVIKTTVDNLGQRLPYGGVASGSYVCGTGFSANYNSLQTSLTKRFSHGLDFLASYTWSKNRDFTSGTGGISSLDLDFLSNDQTNPRQARGLNDFDRKHRFVLSFVYEAPQLASGPAGLRHVLSRWQFSGQAVFQSGLPITVTDSRAGSAYGNLIGFERAQCTGLNPASSGSLFHRVADGYLNPAAFASPPVIGDDGMATGFGNCGVGILRGPSQQNLDLGIQKSIAVTEAANLQFRAEFFNFTNTTKFVRPANDFSAPSFGRIFATVSSPRIIQFALKFNF
jgi:hypothetical protein